jgi:hypothetical protein
MTPDDVRWMKQLRFDADRANRVWQGTLESGEAPTWYGRVAPLLQAARAPATVGELMDEAEVVARMQATIAGDAVGSGRPRHLRANGAGGAAKDRPRHLRRVPESADDPRLAQGARLVGRIVAIKATAATVVVAVGVTAAAAATGIVATVVVPALSDDPPALERPAEPGDDVPSSGEVQGGAGTGGGQGDAPDPSGSAVETGTSPADQPTTTASPPTSSAPAPTTSTTPSTTEATVEPTTTTASTTTSTTSTSTTTTTTAPPPSGESSAAS